jgi:hypothetical protein
LSTIATDSVHSRDQNNLRIGEAKSPQTADDVKPADLVCDERLSRLLKHYELKAA